MKYYSHLNTAADIIRLYQGEQPFHYFIKDFFRQHKKYGSQDRKGISRLCYAYLRLGTSFPGLPMEERLLTGLLLCTTAPDALLENIRPQWNAAVHLPLREKCSIAGVLFDQLSIFPSIEEATKDIDTTAFVLSHLQQPDLFIRVRPGHEKRVLQKLDAGDTSYRQLDDHCIAFPNAAKIDALLDLDEEAVVQDYSSQRVGQLIKMAAGVTAIRRVWDCCAASGGKSIMAKDMLGNIALTVSDVRKTILINLEKRFAAAGIAHYKSMLADLVQAPLNAMDGAFDFIIADVPCSGSGTWGRTPEYLSFFKETEIARYRQLQQQIVSHAFPSLRPGGCLLYITCSVFEKENEGMAAFITQRFPARLLHMETLKGYPLRADTMFVALFVKE